MTRSAFMGESLDGGRLEGRYARVGLGGDSYQDHGQTAHRAGPLGAVRVARINGHFVANPTHAEQAESDLDLVYVGNETDIASGGVGGGLGIGLSAGTATAVVTPTQSPVRRPTRRRISASAVYSSMSPSGGT